VTEKGFHQLNQTIPQGKNPHENEVRHPELPGLTASKDVRQEAVQKRRKYENK
jgi:hypothetical protein